MKGVLSCTQDMGAKGVLPCKALWKWEMGRNNLIHTIGLCCITSFLLTFYWDPKSNNQRPPFTVGCTLNEDQPLTLLLNLFFYLCNHSDSTYNFQCIKLPDVVAECNQL